MGFLGVRFEVGEWVKLPPPRPFVQNLLELCQKLRIWHVSTHSYLVSKNIPFSTQATLILLMSAFFLQKINVFRPKKYLYSKQQCESCVRDFLVLFSGFVRQKGTNTENITFADSGIRPPGCSKLAKNPKNDKVVTIF